MSLILGIESSCDETAAALVTSDREILAHKLAGQEAEHAPYGGVVPEIAARAHAEILTPLIAAALAEADKSLDDVDAVAATAGPGLIGGVMLIYSLLLLWMNNRVLGGTLRMPPLRFVAMVWACAFFGYFTIITLSEQLPKLF